MNKNNNIINVAFFQFATSSMHFAASLEILNKEFRLGNKTFYSLLGQTTYFPSRMAKMGETLLGKAPRHLKHLIFKADPNVAFKDKIEYDENWVQKHMQEFMKQLNQISTISMLPSLQLDSIKPGAAIANEIITYSKDNNMNLIKTQKLVIFLLRSYLEIYSHTLISIKVDGISRVHIYNGRFLHERASWDAAKRLGCEILIFETTHDRFQQRTEGFHNRVNNQKVMKDLWTNSNLEISKKINESTVWFKEMRSNINPFMVRHPKKFISEKKYFVYFSNSDDEVVGFWDEWTEPLGNQFDVVSKLIEIFSNQNAYDLVIRLHPNLLNKPAAVIKKWQSLKTNHNSVLIKSEEKISSYDLIDNCVGVINFGSTIGIEAAYYEKPVLVLADCKYDELEIADKLFNWAEIESWIKNAEFSPSELISKRKMNSYIFGFYFRACGTRFSNTNLKKTPNQGAWEADEFLGIKIQESNYIHNYRKLISKYKFWKIRKVLRFE
jgi:hypothetical protein